MTGELDRTTDAAFVAELEVFRNEVEAATQFFHAERMFHVLAAKHKEVHAFLNRTAMFWNTCTGALQASTIITLGRIFDKKSPHNLDALLKTARNNIGIFSKQALESRKLLRITPADVAEFMRTAYEPTVADFDRIEALVEERRQIYKAHYKNLRHKWFAHRGVSKPNETAELFGVTNIEELNQMFQFLGLLHLQLWELFENGREPNFKASFSGMPGDVAGHIIQEAERFLKTASGVP